MDTTQLVVLFCVAAVTAALGYFVAASKSSRQLAKLAEEVEHADRAHQEQAVKNSELENRLNQSQQLLRTGELALSKADSRVETLVATEDRLKTEKSELDSSLKRVTELLNEAKAQYHASDKKRETSQAELQAQLDKVGELRLQLDNTKSSLEAEREKVIGLKDEVATEGKRAEAATTSLEESRKHFRELAEDRDAQRHRNEELESELKALNRQYTQLKTEQEEREASHAREVANFEKQKESLSEHFKVLSNEILEQKATALQESSKLTLSAVMNPFQQSMDTFKKEVQDIHHRETSQQGELRKELEHLKELNQKITTEAHELSTALRGQKKLQGNWGELVLENVLDRSGLRLDKDYRREVSVTTEDGRKRPDVVVDLPQGKHLIIDSKVSLNAYTRYVNAENDLERDQALKEHVAAVGSRIKELADKDYFKLPGLNSPEMVFMFIPIESAFVEALKADESLFQNAIENNVLVATPTTLLTSLNIVRQLWRYEDQNKHTAALASKAEAVFRKLNTFLGTFEDIKSHLDKAQGAYIKAEGQLVSGRGNLVKQVGEFKNLAPAIKGALPSYFADKAALEIDFVATNQQDTENESDDASVEEPLEVQAIQTETENT